MCALLIVFNLTFEELSVIDLLRSRQVNRVGNKKGTIVIDKERDVNLEIEEKIIEEAQKDQLTLEVKKMEKNSDILTCSIEL